MSLPNNNKKDDINGEKSKNNSFLEKNKEKNDNNNNKNLFSITTSMRGESMKSNNIQNINQNFNLTSKNNSKIKHKKRISNYV